MEAKAGETLKVKIMNVGGFHDFVIDELNVRSTQIAEGESEIVEIMIPADATGEYEFYCSVGNHRAQGMVGTLMIVE
jgi:plastocyanin